MNTLDKLRDFPLPPSFALVASYTTITDGQVA